MTKTVLITGASSGIGKAAALFFASKGWNVAATMRNPEREKDITVYSSVCLLQLDVCDETSIRKAVEDTLRVFGKIDVLVNNAGYGTLGVFEYSTTENVRNQLETNVVGLMSVTRAVLPYFRKQKGGTIINLASIAGKVGFPLFSVYNSSKFAVEGFSEALRYEVERFGVRVKIVEPGPIKTDFYTRSMDFFGDGDIADYNALEGVVKKNIVNMGLQSGGPDVVARTIYRAAVSRSKRLRYPVGGGAPFIVAAKRFLPDCVMRGAIRLMLGIRR